VGVFPLPGEDDELEAVWLVLTELLVAVLADELEVAAVVEVVVEEGFPIVRFCIVKLGEAFPESPSTRITSLAHVRQGNQSRDLHATI
jgi:hypothetical protein